MKDDLKNSSELESKLIYIFSNVNDWLKFAEIKNAGLVAFLIAAISGLLGFTASFQQLNQSLKFGILFCVGFLTISCLISLFTFSPKLKRDITFFDNKDKILESDNLLFFCDLAKYNAELLTSTIAEKYFEIDLKKPLKIHTDIAEQIIVTSKIALAKFHFFKIALNFVFLSIFILFFVSLIHYFFLS